MLAMAKRRTKRKRKVLTVKFDDMQRTNNVDAAVRSFEGPTKATLAIASEIADYSKRSFDHNIKMMENLLNARSLDKAIEVQTEYARAAYEGYVSQATKLGQLYTDLGKEAFKSYQDLAAKATPVSDAR
jgi:hypothetical protein